MEKVYEFKCVCGRGFDTKKGLETHERSCGEAQRGDMGKWEVESILDARGPPQYRFYLVKWKDYPWQPEHKDKDQRNPSWEPRRFTVGCCDEMVSEFWENQPPGRELERDIKGPIPGEEIWDQECRCKWCW